jgi:hypothetical protein
MLKKIKMSRSDKKTLAKQRLQASQPEIIIGDGSNGLSPITIDSGRGLFSPNNPLLKKANEVFSPEQIDEYKKHGEYMYNFDYDKVNLDGSGNDETTQFILMGLRSGLSIQSLGEDEVEFMVSTYGEDWPQRFGFSS